MPDWPNKNGVHPWRKLGQETYCQSGWSFYLGKDVAFVQYVRRSVSWTPSIGSPDGKGPESEGTMGEPGIDNGAGVPYNPSNPNGHWYPQTPGGGITDHPGAGSGLTDDRANAKLMWNFIAGMVKGEIPEYATAVTWKLEYWTYAVQIRPEPRKVLGYWYWYSAMTVTLDPPGVKGDDNGKVPPQFHPIGGGAK